MTTTEPDRAEPDHGLWAPVNEPGSVTDRIVARVEGLIASRQLSVGDRLPPERDMARLLAVSRPTLREALRTLQARGRLVIRHGRGVFIASADDPVKMGLDQLEINLQELFDMREVLEAPAAEWAAGSATDQDLAELRSSLAQQEAARLAGPDYERLAVLDAAFHLRIVEMANNRFLKKTVDVLQEMLASGMETTLSIPGRPEESAHDHRRIYEAIERGDGAEARVAARDHIRGACAAAMARIEQEKGTLADD